MSTRRVLAGAVALALLRTPGPAVASDPLPSAPAPVVDDGSTVDVDGPARGTPVPLPESTRAALRSGDWATAYAALKAMDTGKLVGDAKSDHAFLVVWSAVRANKAAEALPWLTLLDACDTDDDCAAPPAWRAVVRAEVLSAAGERQAALDALKAVPETSAVYPRAVAVHAEVLRALERTSEAYVLWESLAARPDPSDGVSVALWTLAKRKGFGSEASYPLLRRLWVEYPTSWEGKEAEKTLAASYPGRLPTPSEIVRRAEVRQASAGWADAVSLTEPLVGTLAAGTLDGCRLAYVRGRALYKQNKLTESMTAFGDAGRKCVGVDGEYGDKILYLLGEAQFRKALWTSAAASYLAIGELYPGSSMVDDGLTRGGIALSEAGDKAGAMKAWRRALDEHADGDTVPEASFRLAFALYDTGDTPAARQVALRVASLPQGADEVHVMAGRYWAARWLAYPKVADPDALGPAEDVQAAVEAWRELLERTPWGWYATLAYSRLKELAPDVAAGIVRRPIADVPWTVRASFLAGDGGAALGLMRLGLHRDALAVWEHVSDDVTPDEMAWWTEQRTAAGDWLLAHDAMHRWLRQHPVGTLGPHELQIVRVSYPNRYWDEVRTATSTYAWEPRMYHALVREESLFNKDVVSHAGAIGLGQVMPATGRTVAGWLGISFSTSDLKDPAKNLRLGARYLDSVLGTQGGNPCLAFASYNAGPARVDQWVATRGNLPLDEFVERIPFRETRGYVKRVTSTWQTYRYAVDTDGAPFVDLSRFNHQVKPTSGATADGS